MEWYGWLLLILLFLTIIGFILYLVFKPRDKTLSEIKKQLRDTERAYKDLRNKSIKEAVEKKNLEKKITELKLEELEKKYAYDIATLSKKEKKNYEEAKKNPSDGISFIKSIINDK